MRFKILFLGLWLISTLGYSQYNHVRNADFEEIYGDISCSLSPVNHYSQLIHYWQPMWPWTVPTKTGLQNIGSPDHNCYDGPVGPHWATMTSKEYVVQALDKPLERGKLYYLSYYYHGDAKTDVGIRFYKDKPKQKNSSSNIHDNGPAHIDGTQYVNTGIITAPVYGEWKKAWKYWVADENYAYMAIGAFNKVEAAPNMDGIRIIEVGSSECPEWNVIQNTSYTDNVDLIYKSSYITGAGANVSATEAPGPLTIAAQSTVTLKSANKVVMEEGFHVPEGGTLHAFIAPCYADCFPPTADAGPDYTICQKGSFSVGTSSSYLPENTYVWTAQPASALMYLSCTNCPNPQINLPQVNDFGGIRYTLTVTNACGETASDEVYLFYDLNSAQSSPSVNVYNIAYNDYFESDVSCNNHTEYVYVEVYNNSDNSLVYSKSLHRGDDFINIPFHWKMDQYLTNCEDYTIKVYSKNFCKPDFSTAQTISWIRNRNINLSLSPNVFTPPNPPNEKLCYGITGAENYEITVVDPHGGATIYHTTGTLGPNGCIWDGTCNGSTANCPGGYVSDGTYQIVVSFWNCETKINQAQTITVFNDQNKMVQTGNGSSGGGLVSPNPNNGIFDLYAPDEFKSTYTVDITNSVGERIYHKEDLKQQMMRISLELLPEGIYFLHIFDSKHAFSAKIVIN